MGGFLHFEHHMSFFKVPLQGDLWRPYQGSKFHVSTYCQAITESLTSHYTRHPSLEQYPKEQKYNNLLNSNRKWP